MTALLIALTAFFLLYLMTTARRAGLLAASSLFSYTQMLMAAGTFAQLSEANRADVAHAWVITTAMLSFFLVNSLFTFTQQHRTPLSSAPLATTYTFNRLTWTMLVLSVAVVGAYYAAVGSSALLVGIQSSFSGVGVDIAGARLNAYAGSQYFAPGYVNQFRNSLLPALVVVLSTARLSHRPRRLWRLLPLMLFAVLGMLGTGQRGALIVFTVTTLVYLYNVSGRRLTDTAYKVAAVSLGFVILSTFALGRSSASVRLQDNPVGKVNVLAAELFDRVTYRQQLSSVAAFRYIYYLPIQNGGEWAEAARGILPGHRGSDLANRIFSTMYGSTRGTSPPSIWGSIYHNFGWSGTVLWSAIIGMLLAILSSAASTPRRCNTLECMGMSGTFVVMGSWVAGSPVYLLNAGLLVYIWLWWLGRRESTRSRARIPQAPITTEAHPTCATDGDSAATGEIQTPPDFDKPPCNPTTTSRPH